MNAREDKAYTFLAYEEIIAELSQIFNNINSDVLPEKESLLLKRMKTITNDYAGICKAYCLLNDYFIELQLEAKPSSFNDEIVGKLSNIYIRFAKDPAYNWFGIPHVSKLIEAKMYGGEKQFGQRMQVLIADLAKLTAKAREALQPQLKEMMSKVGPLDMKFIKEYINGSLSSEKIKHLDLLSQALWEHSADFVTIQTALHFYRFLIAARCSPPSQTPFYPKIVTDFFVPRTTGMPITHMHPDLEKKTFIANLLALIPDGELKDFYFQNAEDIDEEDRYKYGLNFYLSDYFGVTIERRSSYLLEVRTPLTSEHYQYHMKKILDEMDVDQLVQNPKTGSLPCYEYTKEKDSIIGSLADVEFFDAYFGMKKGVWTGKIQNNKLFDMVNKAENWRGELLYKHFNALYTISLLTDDLEVAEQARRRLEWWYSDVVPYDRGSASISEAISKTLQLSHFIIPTQLYDVFADLKANFQYDEDEYVEHHEEIFPRSQYKIPDLAASTTLKTPLSKQSLFSQEEPGKEIANAHQMVPKNKK